MNVYKAAGWIRSDDRKHEPWKAGFTPSQLMDRNASGSSMIGQLADLYNSSTESDWGVSMREAHFSYPELRRHRVSASWDAVVIELTADRLLDIQAPLRITADKLDFIKQAFDISLSNLAKILRTSRPSLYAWFEGEEPRDASVRRIQEINEYAELWKGLNQFHFSPGPLFRQEQGSSPSMLDRLAREELDRVEVESGFRSLVELMQRRKERMDRAKQRAAKSATSENAATRARHSLTSSIGSSD